MGLVEADTWGFLDVDVNGNAYLCIGVGRGSPAYHSGVTLGPLGTASAHRAAAGLLACVTDADIDSAITALPGYATGPWPSVSGSAWWATLTAPIKAQVRGWIRAKALTVC